MRSRSTAGASEAPVSYDGSGLLNSHQIVSLVITTVVAHEEDRSVSKQIADTLTQADRSGEFEKAESSRELATLLTGRVRSVTGDNRYQVLYSLAPPDIEQAHGRSMYRISEHLSVGLPSR